jgi:uncharacterized membrane protein YbhN (UPF0104 family)
VSVWAVAPDTQTVAAMPPATTDFTLPRLDVQAVARRAALPAGLAAALVALVLLAGGPLQVFTDALERALAADPRWIAVAAGAEVLSFVGYVMLLWHVGQRATPRLDLRASTDITLAGAAATRLLPTGGAGGAALTLWAMGRTGLGMRRGGHVLLTFLVLLYSVFLAGIAASGLAILLGAGGDAGHAAVAAAATVAALAGIAASLALALRSPASPRRVARGGAALGSAVRSAVGVLRGGDARLAGAPVWWVFDAMVLWATFHALGEPPALPVLAFAYFVGQVGNTLPLPGAVSGGMVGTLLAFGVAPDLAVSAVLAYRAVAIWLPAPAGLVALGSLRARVARWTAEDADEAAVAVAVPAEPAAVAAPTAPADEPVANRHALRTRAALRPPRPADCPVY